jgi:hypothetical protein
VKGIITETLHLLFGFQDSHLMTLALELNSGKHATQTSPYHQNIDSSGRFTFHRRTSRVIIDDGEDSVRLVASVHVSDFMYITNSVYSVSSIHLGDFICFMRKGYLQRGHDYVSKLPGYRLSS